MLGLDGVLRAACRGTRRGQLDEPAVVDRLGLGAVGRGQVGGDLRGRIAGGGLGLGLRLGLRLIVGSGDRGGGRQGSQSRDCQGCESCEGCQGCEDCNARRGDAAQ